MGRARTRIRLLKSALAVAGLSACVALSSGCAVTSATVLDEARITNTRPMSSYRALVVKVFNVKPDQLPSISDPELSDRDLLIAKFPENLAASIVDNVRKRRIYQSVVTDGNPPADALILNGRFTRIGRFRISIEAVLTDAATGTEVAHFRHTLWDIADTSGAVQLLGREVSDFIDQIQYK